MNDAVYKFKRYEDASLSYTGINRHEGEDRGGWDTVLSDADYNKMFTLQQASMEAPAPAPDDLPAKPYFTPDEDEPKPAPEKKPAPQPTKPIISYGGFTPKTNTAQSTQASGNQPLSQNRLSRWMFPKSRLVSRSSIRRLALAR